jgi:hypothetical protein
VPQAGSPRDLESSLDTIKGSLKTNVSRLLPLIAMSSNVLYNCSHEERAIPEDPAIYFEIDTTKSAKDHRVKTFPQFWRDGWLEGRPPQKDHTGGTRSTIWQSDPS